jgi:hypothetical protein
MPEMALYWILRLAFEFIKSSVKKIDMPFGQSIAVRFAAKAIAAALGADPVTQTTVSRVAGWLVAHLTLDHHAQALIDADDAFLTDLYESEQEQRVLESAAGEIFYDKSMLAEQAYEYSIRELGLQTQERYVSREFKEKFINVLEEFLSLGIYFIISDLREPDDYFRSYMESIKAENIDFEDIDFYRTAINFTEQSIKDKLSQSENFPVDLIESTTDSLHFIGHTIPTNSETKADT